MSSLLEFLRARLDEDEAAARDVRPDQEYSDSEHQDRWTPARVLRQVEANRRIIDLHPVGYWDSYGKPELQTPDKLFCETCDVEDGMVTVPGRPCLTLRLLASPYDGHPDYDEAWRP